MPFRNSPQTFRGYAASMRHSLKNSFDRPVGRATPFRSSSRQAATKDMRANDLTTHFTAAKVAIAAIVTYQILLIILILLRPDLDPYWHTISEWAIGPYGWLMTIGFILSSASYFALFITLRRQISGVVRWIGLGILLICSIGAFGVGAFTMDPFDTQELTTRGILHIVCGMLQAMLLPFAALLINLNLAFRNPAWAAERKALVLTAGLPLLALIGSVVHLVLYVIPLGPDARGPNVPIGYPPRLVFLSYAVWVVVVARSAIRVSRHGLK